MEILTSTKAITGSIENIVDTATEEAYLVTAYVNLTKKTDKGIEEWKDLIERIKVKRTRKERKVNFIFIVRDPKNMEKEKEILNSLRNYADQIWLVPDLHAKFYYNGDRLLISSMNLILHSTKKNPEIGVTFKKPSSSNPADLEIFNRMRFQIEDYISLLKQEGRNILSAKSESKEVKLKLIKWGRGYSLKANNNQNLGFCIVCGNATPKVDYRKGIFVRCKNCYKRDSSISDKIKGSRCHVCGQKASVSAKHAYCSSCANQLTVLLEKIPSTN